MLPSDFVLLSVQGTAAALKYGKLPFCLCPGLPPSLCVLWMQWDFCHSHQWSPQGLPSEEVVLEGGDKPVWEALEADLLPCPLRGPAAHVLFGRSMSVESPLLRSGFSHAAEVCSGMFYLAAPFSLTCLALSVCLCMENCQLVLEMLLSMEDHPLL